MHRRTIHTTFIDSEVLLIQGVISLFEQNNISGIVPSGHYESLSSFLSDHSDQCDLVISDLDLHDPNIIEHVPSIKKRFPEARVIVLTNYDNYKLVRDTMKAGCDGYILKKSSFGELIKCIEEVIEGAAHIGNGIKLAPSRRLFEEKKTKNEDYQVVRKYEDRYQVRQKLTKREIEVLRLIVQTKTNKEIGEELFISDQTVGVHKKNIMRKLNVRSTLTLIKYAMEQNLV